jgi:23S rRNA A2030 N6-methylase RlmJ
MSSGEAYQHRHQPGSHADVLKGVVYINAIKLLQEKYPEGIILVDTHSGPGVYDVIPDEYHNGAARVVAKNNDPNAPSSVKKYVALLNKLKAEFGDGTVPGSPLFARELMRDQDEHRLCDLNEDDVEGLYEDADFRKLDCYSPDGLDFILPETETKHPVILIDPGYEDASDYLKVKELVESILMRRSDATVLVWVPFIRNDRNRWSYPKGLKDLAKERATIGRYFCSIIVDTKDLEGSAMLVTNPTNDMDDAVSEDVLNWLAATMHKGKADYSVEQAMKKKKKVIPS